MAGSVRECDGLGRRGGRRRAGAIAAALVMGAAAALTASRSGQRVTLEEPWNLQGEVVVKPGLTFNQMRELHGQLPQTRWASKFGSDLPKQVRPIEHGVARSGSCRAAAGRRGRGGTALLSGCPEQGVPTGFLRQLLLCSTHLLSLCGVLRGLWHREGSQASRSTWHLQTKTVTSAASSGR